jgi:hypothetical protein
MAQFGRPSADTYNGDGWTEDDGDTTNMFQEIDESSADDGDYIRSPASPSNDVYVTKLTTIVDPVSSASHVLRVRNSVDQADQETIDFTFELREGYTNEGSPGTLIASTTRTGVTSTSWTTTSYTLSGGEADAITDYTDLFVRIKANKP